VGGVFLSTAAEAVDEVRTKTTASVIAVNVPLNDDGFRSDFIPSGGIEYTF